MRIERLQMRYGHLTDEVLEFPADRLLHVVLGANEAGKSTALDAIGDGLFGFKDRTTRDFLHPASALRVGFKLSGADGRQASFVRRKGRRDTLQDEGGTVLPPAALAPFLCGVDRERFRQVFGLNAEQLREGGRTIMTDQGGAGATILQAQTGLRGLRDTVARLDEEAKALHGDGRGVRRISAAAKAYHDQRRLMAERTLSGPAFQAARDLLAQLLARRTEIEADTKMLRAEQARLERTRRTAPVRGALAQAYNELAKLGPPPPLPPDAGVQLQAALMALAMAQQDLARDRSHALVVQTALAALATDVAMLADADAVSAWLDDRTRIADMRLHWAEQKVIATQRQGAMDAAGAQLGLVERGAALRARIPGALTRKAAARLVSEHDRLSGTKAQAAETAEDAARNLKAAILALEGLAVPDAGDALRDAVAAANEEGRVDEALANAATAQANAASAATIALAGLQLWSGTANALAAAQPPLEAEAFQLGQALETAQAAVDTKAKALATHDRGLDATAADLLAVASAGALPTAEAVAAARGRRDAAWRLVRRTYIAGGPPPSPEELAALDAAHSLPDALDRLLWEADDLADRRLSEAVRLAKWEGLRTTEVRDKALRIGLVAQHESAQRVLDAAETAWRAAWAPSGVQPLDPAAMRDWAARRLTVLALANNAAEAQRRREQEQARHDRLVDGLAALLPDAARDGGVAPLQREAARRLVMLDAAATAYGKARDNAGTTQRAWQRAADTLADNDRKLEDWGIRWRDAAQALGLAMGSTADDGDAALALWTDIQTYEAAWRDATDRITQMDVALAAHDSIAAALAARLGAPVGDADAPALRTRLEAARAARTERERLEAEARNLATAIAAHLQDETQTETRLEALRRLAGATDDEGLLAAIGRAAAHAALAATVRDREAELHHLDDGKTAAELDYEAAEMDIDAIPARLVEIETRLRELDAERVELGGRLAECKADLQQKEDGQDVAGPAQGMQDSLAEIQQDADRYVRLRLAHALLRGGIDGYRRSQQGPLMTRAGGYFETLTDGRYHRLDLDEGQKGEPLIVAARRDGSHCPAEELSEGTRDQLFLALRLASIGLEAQTTEPLPLIADDLLVNFDDRRALAALRMLAEFGRTTQVILFTHHAHIAGMIDPATASLHRMPAAATA